MRSGWQVDRSQRDGRSVPEFVEQDLFDLTVEFGAGDGVPHGVDVVFGPLERDLPGKLRLLFGRCLKEFINGGAWAFDVILLVHEGAKRRAARMLRRMRSMHLHRAASETAAEVVELHVRVVGEQGHGHGAVGEALGDHERGEALTEGIVM